VRGNPHAAFDEAGAGNVARSRCCDTRTTERASNREYKLRPTPARQSSTLPKNSDAEEPTCMFYGEGCYFWGGERAGTQEFCRGRGDDMCTRGRV
jgi:hypothetical protein